MPGAVPPSDPLVEGVVVALHRLGCVVERAGVRYECKREKGADVCVGDAVQFEPVGGGRGAIRERLPRRSWYARGAEGGRRTKLVAANADILAIVVSTAQPELQPGLIDRFLVLAGVGHMQPIICMNKMDLPEAAQVDNALAPYEQTGIPTFRLVAITNEGVAALHTAIREKRVLFCGFSGVGKSTLINALVGDHERLRTGDVSAATGKGTHTTTWVDWIPLDERTVVIDTPGIRQLSLAMLAPEEIQAGFPEFAAYTGRCQFQNCRHETEPDCAVRAAVDRGEIPRRRYDRYRAILGNP